MPLSGRQTLLEITSQVKAGNNLSLRMQVAIIAERVKRITLSPNSTTLAESLERLVKEGCLVDLCTATLFKQGNVEVLELMDIDQLLQCEHCDEKQKPCTIYCP